MKHVIHSIKDDTLLFNIVKYLVLALFFLFLLFPLYGCWSRHSRLIWKHIWFRRLFSPRILLLDSFVKLFTVNNQFFIYYKNNLIVSAAVALICCAVSVFSGYSLARFKHRWSRWVFALLLASQMFPIISRMISLYSILGKLGIINSLGGLILAILAAQVPFCIILMSSFFSGIPLEIEEAAYVDGANKSTILFRIVVPLVKSGLLAVGIYAFLMTWDDYLHAATLIQNDARRTLSVGIALRYLGELSYDWSLVNTISIVGTVPVVLIFFFFQKYMIKGLVAGAVKG